MSVLVRMERCMSDTRSGMKQQHTQAGIAITLSCASDGVAVQADGKLVKLIGSSGVGEH